MAPRIAKSAELVRILVFYDEPQLVFLKSDRKYPMFGVAVRAAGSRPFFGCETKDRVTGKYFEGKVDLRYVFDEAVNNRYYTFDLDEEREEGITLSVAENSVVERDDVWPQVGFFSRSHTDPLNRKSGLTSGIMGFKIDGNWGANDFSLFYGKMSDLYAILAVLNRFDGTTGTEEKAFIKGAIEERLWRGGGSYVGFYDELLDRVTSVSPLEVAKIEYASPGQIAFRGEESVFQHISDVINVFDQSRDEIVKRSATIRTVLQKEKLLSANAETEFSSKAIHDYVFATTNALLRDLGIEKCVEIYAACGANTLVFAKVALSIFRRARDLHLFQAEGRVQR